MGRLAGFHYRQIVKRLKRLGFAFDRQAAGSHEIWFNTGTGRYTTIPNHPGDRNTVVRPRFFPEMATQLGHVLDGYEDFRALDPRELHLLEALRTLRLLHDSAWIARRWNDPAFPAAFT
jgi:predicted RNA binding protein YcfA (HicA-like mRNA interferase family)